jgi:hypothetical protein
MKRDIKQLRRLIVQLMDIQGGDREAKRRWEQRVRDAYPYGRMILTAKLGEIVDLSGRKAHDEQDAAHYLLGHRGLQERGRSLRRDMHPLQQVREMGRSGRGR